MLSLFPIIILFQTFCNVRVRGNVLPLLDIDDGYASAGYFHTCALENRPGIEFGGGIKCWGDNRRGQTSAPPGIHRQVSCGKFFSCAITIGGQISCWGDMEGRVPADGGRFTQLSVGQSHACALRSNGRVECWGRNDFGETDPPQHHFKQVRIPGLFFIFFVPEK